MATYTGQVFPPSTPVITLSTPLEDFTGSKVVVSDKVISIMENVLQDSVDVEFGYVQSDTTISPSFNKVSNVVSLTQAAYDAIVTPDTETLYIIVG